MTLEQAMAHIAQLEQSLNSAKVLMDDLDGCVTEENVLSMGWAYTYRYQLLQDVLKETPTFITIEAQVSPDAPRQLELGEEVE